jgi:hypothetical protein
MSNSSCASKDKKFLFIKNGSMLTSLFWNKIFLRNQLIEFICSIIIYPELIIHLLKGFTSKNINFFFSLTYRKVNSGFWTLISHLFFNFPFESL